VNDTGGTVLAGADASSPGTLTIDGTYSLSNTGSFTSVVTGTGVGQTGDLDVNGTVNLNGGTLQVDTANGFNFALGQTFTVMNFTPGSLTGNFGSISYGANAGSDAGVDIGNGLALQAVYNNSAGNVQLEVVSAPAPPSITAPTSIGFVVGQTTLITPLGITDAAAGTGPLTVTLNDSVGTLSAVASGAGAVTGAGSNSLTLTGNLADINAMLASVAYTSQSTGADTIHMKVTDEHNASVSQDIAASTFTLQQTVPVLNAPFGTVLIPGQSSGIGGVTVSDPYAAANNQQISLTLTSTGLATGPITVTGGPGGTVTGNGTDQVTITGTVAQVNSYLSDGITEDILADAYKKAKETAEQVDKTYGKAFALFFGLATGALAEGLAGAGTEFGKFLEDQAAEAANKAQGSPNPLPTPPNLGSTLLTVDAGIYSFAANVLNDVAALAAGATTFPPISC
jgi:hypothetical protein